MGVEKVVSIASRRIEQGAKEYAVFMKLIGDDVQFKLIGDQVSETDKDAVAEACEAIAKALRKPRY